MDTITPRPADPTALDPDPWAEGGHTLQALGARITVHAPDGADLTLDLERHDPEGADAVLTAGDTVGEAAGVTLRLDVPLGDAAGYWHPDTGWSRTLPPVGATPWQAVSLLRSSPVGCLYDSAGHSLLAFATDRTVEGAEVRFGLCPERRRFAVWLRFPLAAGGSCRLHLAAPGPTVAAALRRLRVWLAGQPGGRPLPVPAVTRTPVYSTRYAFAGDLRAAEVEREAVLATGIGFGRLLLDDGWQSTGTAPGYAGCGDWRPDPDAFPDFGHHVRTVRGHGLPYALWIAPLLLGEHSTAYPAWAPYAPHHAPRLDCRILDPRHAEVRRHVVDTCRTLVAEYGLDGLTLDLLDEAAVYADAPGPAEPAAGFIADPGRATARMLADLHTALRAVRGDEVVVELRQAAPGPATAAYATALRATAPPADPVAHRVRTLDLALLAPGGTVHAEPLAWDPYAAPETLVSRFQGGLHAVPQVSARLAELSEAHRATLRFWLATWRRLSAVLLGGHYEPGRPDELYPQVVASRGNRRVVTSYADRLVPLPAEAWRTLCIVNASAAPTVLVEVAGPPRLVRMTTYDARGERWQSGTLALTPGVHEIEVPPSGLCSLILSSSLFALSSATS
ncbi:alpha-galactosidase [Kitasatospora camelliae]|uniref:Alpha-galactosidase n=1 Tax=Kitasatospora camelliae TaxID=3156397 RepID=A0AAU8K465_9ACTN